ncbi:MAG: hypothetical protein JRD89_10470 [Deltaproteobacteria bacterium]|nr:hypothetical protein [Deltaproteobacteria bacterium]
MGPSTNSWKITTSKDGDIYIGGRDNFQQSKVSLHQSGRWRLADLQSTHDVSTGSDRAVAKWTPPLGWKREPVVAFRILLLEPALYLTATDRIGWKKRVLFVEPPADSELMTVVSICVIPDGQDFDYTQAHGGKLAVLTLVEGMHVHVLATHTPAWTDGLSELRVAILGQWPDVTRDLMRDGVVLVHGRDEDSVRFLAPLPLRLWDEEPAH